MITALLVVAAVANPFYPAFAVDRSSTERAKFAKMNPCPVDGVAKYYNCKGYNIDVIKPICAGGTDTADNFQWMRIKNKQAKDAIERAYCQCVKKYTEVMCPAGPWRATPEVKK